MNTEGSGKRRRVNDYDGRLYFLFRSYIGERLSEVYLYILGSNSRRKTTVMFRFVLGHRCIELVNRKGLSKIRYRNLKIFESSLIEGVESG